MSQETTVDVLKKAREGLLAEASILEAFTKLNAVVAASSQLVIYLQQLPEESLEQRSEGELELYVRLQDAIKELNSPFTRSSEAN